MRIFILAVAISVTATVAHGQQQYTVQPGDSLRQIAARELGNVGAWRELCDINDLADCDRILAGQVLRLSAEQNAVAETAPPLEDAPEPAETVTAARQPGPAETATSASPAQNMVQNSRLNGAAIGIVGEGGALPDGWSIGGFQEAEIVQTGIEAGRPFIDLRLAGAPAGNAIFVNFVTSESSIDVAPGQTWTSSAFIRLVDGSLTNIDSVFLRVQEFAGADGKGSSGTNVTLDLDTGLRASVTRDISDAATNRLISFFRLGVPEGDIDLTLRISGPQIEQAARAGDVQLTGNGG